MVLQAGGQPRRILYRETDNGSEFHLPRLSTFARSEISTLDRTDLPFATKIRQYNLNIRCNHSGPCSLLHQSFVAQAACMTPPEAVVHILRGNPNVLVNLHGLWHAREIATRSHSIVSYGEYHERIIVGKTEMPKKSELSSLCRTLYYENTKKMGGGLHKRGQINKQYVSGKKAWAVTVLGVLGLVRNIREKRLRSAWYRMMSPRAYLQAFGIDINTPSIDRAVDKLSNLFDGMSEGFTSAALPEIGKAAWRQQAIEFMLSVVSFLGVVFTSRAVAPSLFAFQALLQSLGVSVLKIGEHIKNLIHTFIAHTNGIHLQAGADELAMWLPCVGGVAFVLFTAFLGKTIPTATGLDLIMRRFKDLPLACRGVATVYQTAVDYVKQGIAYAFQGTLAAEGLPIDPYSRLSAWLKEVTEICTLGNFSRLAFDEALVHKVGALYDEGNKMNEAFSKLKVDSSQLGAFRTGLMSLSLAVAEARKSGAGGIGPRQEPVLIHMCGGTGVGKSSLTWALIVDFFKMKLKEDDAQKVFEQTYFRKVGQEYWDGMDSQKQVVVYDDAGSMVDSASKPNPEFLEAIHTANIAPYPVHMAALTEKANTFFKAKMILWTSNQINFATPSLTNPEAIKRRVDLQVVVKPTPECAKDTPLGAMMDQEKARQLDDFAQAYIFDIVDKHDPNHKVLRADLTYDQFREEVFKIYDSKMQNSDFLIEQIRKRITLNAGEENISTQPPVLTNEILSGTRSWKLRNAKFAVRASSLIPHLRALEEVRVMVPKDTAWFRSTPYHCDLDNLGLVSCIHQMPSIEIPHKDFARICNAALPGELLEQSMCHTISGDREGIVASWMIAEKWLADHHLPAGITEEYVRPVLIRYIMDELNVRGAISACKCEDNPFLLKGVSIPTTLVRTGKLEKFFTYETCITALLTVASSIFSIWAMHHISKLWLPEWKEDPEQDAALLAKINSDNPYVHESHSDKTNSGPRARVESHQNKENVGPRAKVEAAMLDIQAGVTHQSYDFAGVAGQGCRCTMCPWCQECQMCAWHCHHAKKEDERLEQCKNSSKKLDLQGCVDSGCVELMTKLSQSSTYRIERNGVNGWIPLGSITFVKNRDAICNEHFISLMRKSDKIRVWSITRPTPIEFYVKDLLNVTASELPSTLNQRDIAILRFPRTMMPHTNILSRFVSAGKAGWISTISRAYLMGPSISQGGKSYMKYYCMGDTRAQDGVIEADDAHKIYRQYYEYPVDTVKGDCGMLLVMSDTNNPGKILGVHFAGRDGVHYSGLATPVSREMIEQLLERLPRENDLSIPEPQAPTVTLLSGVDALTICDDVNAQNHSDHSGGHYLQIPISGEIMPLGKTKVAHCARDSKIIPSPLANMFPRTCLPAQLRTVQVEDQIIDPRITSLSKVGQPVIPVDTEDLDEIGGALLNLYRSKQPSTTRIFSLEESIKGCEELPYFQGICRSTSAGFGWEGGNGKKKWLGEGEEYITNHPEVVRKVNKRIDTARQGRRTMTVWVDTLKDERRPIAKVLAGKTRTFAVGPLDYNLAFRMYFGAFMNHMMENRIEFESCVGTNVYSADWDAIAYRLQKKGSHIVAGDFSNFDGTLNADILWKILDVVNDWYDDDNRAIREVLFCEIVHSIHTCDGFLYSWTHSQPSGNPGTVIWNSIYNSFVMRYAYKHSVPENLSTMMHFDRYVAMVNYGDDNVLNISSEIINNFNQLTITKALRKIGMEYTDEAKTGNLVVSRPLNEVSFLKRTFRMCPLRKRFVAPLSMDTIREMCLWVKKNQDPDFVCAVNVTTACYEAAFHEKKVFEEFVGVVAKHAVKLKIRPEILAYSEYARMSATEGLLRSGALDLLSGEMGLSAMVQQQSAANPELAAEQFSHLLRGEGYLPLLMNVCSQANKGYSSDQTTGGMSHPLDWIKRLATKITTKLQSGEDVTGTLPEIMSGNTQTQEIVHFNDDGKKEVAALAKIASAAPCAVSTATELKDHTIKNFLKRPIRLSTFPWSDGDARAKLLAQFDFPSSLFTKRMINQKLEGFTFFRGSQVFKIQVNATPFMQGRLLAVFVPYGTYQQRLNTSLQHLGGITGYPHIDLDLSQGQTMSLKVPFVSPLTHLNLVRGFGTVGKLQIYVYGKLSSAETTSVNVTTWAWFEDVDLEVPTGLPVSPLWGAVTLQAGEGGASDVAEINAKIPINWEAIANLASGLDKPTNTQTAMMMAPSLGRSLANANSVDNSKTFSMAPVAYVKNFDGKFGSTQDEMKLNYVVQTPTFMDSFDWAVGQKEGTVLIQIPTHPMYCTPAGFKGGWNPTTLAYTTSAFKYYTGSLVYSFKFIKTNFHSGRLRVLFAPGLLQLRQANTFDPNKCYSVVFDMRDKSEFELRIPYVNHAPWTRVYRDGASAWQDYRKSTEPTGWVEIQVLNELKAPGITANTIQCNIEVRGGDDFRLAYPSASGCLAKTSGPQSTVPKAVLQAFEDLVTRDMAQENVEPPTELFPTSSSSNDKCPEQYCTGEAVQSVRSLLHRGCFIGEKLATELEIDPFFVATATDNEITNPDDRNMNDYYTHFSYLYAFRCGGMRVKAIPVGSKPNVVTTLVPFGAQSLQYNDAVRNKGIDPAQYVCNFPRTANFTTSEGIVELEVPFYSQTYAAMTDAYMPTLSQPEDPTNYRPQRINMRSLDGEQRWYLFRSCADDFAFGYLVGPPVVASTYGTIS